MVAGNGGMIEDNKGGARSTDCDINVALHRDIYTHGLVSRSKHGELLISRSVLTTRIPRSADWSRWSGRMA